MSAWPPAEGQLWLMPSRSSDPDKTYWRKSNNLTVQSKLSTVWVILFQSSFPVVLTSSPIDILTIPKMSFVHPRSFICSPFSYLEGSVLVFSPLYIYCYLPSPVHPEVALPRLLLKWTPVSWKLCISDFLNHLFGTYQVPSGISYFMTYTHLIFCVWISFHLY